MTEQEHVLMVLAEECSEVIKEVSKALRFGLDSHAGLDDHAPNCELSNSQKLSNELGDLMGVMEMLIDRGVIDAPDPSQSVLKKIRIGKYIEYAKNKGTIIK